MSETTLRLQTNVTEFIALEFEDGLPVSSKFGGDQMMFSLTDGRKLYLSPFAAAKISAAGVRAGQTFGITKREVANGNRRTVEYQIETGDSPRRQNATADVVQTPAAVVSITRNGSTQQNQVPSQNTATVLAIAPAAESAPSSVALMKVAGCGAIDAVLEIEKYAQTRGLVDFVFGAENVQKIAVTLFMEMTRKAGRV